MSGQRRFLSVVFIHNYLSFYAQVENGDWNWLTPNFSESDAFPICSSY